MYTEKIVIGSNSFKLIDRKVKCCVSDDIVSGIGVYKEEDHEANVLEALNVATLSSYHNRKYAEHAIGVYKRNMKENRLRNAESNGVH